MCGPSAPMLMPPTSRESGSRNTGPWGVDALSAVPTEYGPYPDPRIQVRDTQPTTACPAHVRILFAGAIDRARFRPPWVPSSPARSPRGALQARPTSSTVSTCAWARTLGSCAPPHPEPSGASSSECVMPQPWCRGDMGRVAPPLSPRLCEMYGVNAIQPGKDVRSRGADSLCARVSGDGGW